MKHRIDIPRPRRRTDPRRGSILIVALVVLFALAAMTVAMAHTARVQAALAANAAARAEAQAVVRAAEQFVIRIIEQEDDTVLDRPDEDFIAQPVGAGYFWILRSDLGDASRSTWGIMDETDAAQKLDVNTASVDLLLEIPGMTQEMAEAIFDWRGGNDALELANYYQTLPTPYEPKGERFEHVEELLLVRGVTPGWLFGSRYADPSLGQAGRSSVLEDEAVETGTFDYLTTYRPGGNAAAGNTYSADIVGVSGNGRAFCRSRIVVGIRNGEPRVMYRRDITGRGWPLDPAILASLRRGEGLQEGLF